MIPPPFPLRPGGTSDGCLFGYPSCESGNGIRPQRTSVVTRVKAKSTAPVRALVPARSVSARQGWLAIIPALSALLEIVIDTTSPQTDVLPLEFSAVPRPSGRLLLLGQVPCLAPFRAVLGARLWMRWRELEPDHDLDRVQIEIAWASWDAPSSTAGVIARARVPDRSGAWALFRVAQAQGVVDLFLAGPASCEGRAEVLHLLVCADVSQRSE